MNHICELCNMDSLFFIWSTSRYFNRKKLLKIISKDNTKLAKMHNNRISNENYVVCQSCVHKFGLMDK